MDQSCSLCAAPPHATAVQHPVPVPWSASGAYHARLAAQIMRNRASAPATESRKAAVQGYPFVVDEGGGAFYGPKIDIKVQPPDPRPHTSRIAGRGPCPSPSSGQSFPLVSSHVRSAELQA